MKVNEVLSDVELSEEEKQIVNEYIKRIDIYSIEKMQMLTDIETKKLYKEQDMLLCIQTKFNIEVTDFSDDGSDVGKSIDLLKNYFISLKNNIQRIITCEKDNYEESFDLDKIRDEFIDINFELKLRGNKLTVIRETLLNHYKDLGYHIIALQNVEIELQSEINKGTISKDYEKIKIKEKINDTISNLKGMRINIANSIVISENLAQQYKELAENYDENKMFYLIQGLYNDGVRNYAEHLELTNEIIPKRFARLERRINKLYSVCKVLHKISASRKTGFNELKLLKERLYNRYDNIINTSQYDKYPEFENSIISELAQIECKIEEYIYDTRKSAEEIIAYYIKKIYNSCNYKDFHDLETELHKLEAIEELYKQYSPYLETEVKRELQKQILVLKFNLFYRRQIELLIYGNQNDEFRFVEDNLSEQEKVWFNYLLEQKIKTLKEQYEKRKDSKDEALFEISASKILYDRNFLEKVVIMDLKYNPYEYITLLKAKIFNAHLCNIANNPFEPEIYITKEQLNLYYSWGLKANKVNYSMLVALLKNIITDENVSIIECDSLYRRFGFKCNPIIFNIGQECIKAIFEQVKYTKEYFEISDSITIRNKRKLEIPYCKMNIKGLRYYFNNLDLNEEKYKDIIDNAILLVSEEIQKKQNAFLEKNKLDKSERKTITSYETDSLKDCIEADKSIISALIDIKNQKKKSTLEDMRNALGIINDIYSKFYVRHNVRRILPLEDMSNSQQVYLVEIPSRRKKNYNIRINYFNREIIYDAKPLWQKYEREFNELGIRVHLVNPHNFDTDARFKIYVNLNDILELPIDLKKVKLITNEELKELMERNVKKENTSTNIDPR